MHWQPISDRIAEVFHLPVLTQTLPPFQHTNSFLVGQRDLALVDAGQWDDPMMAGLGGFLAAEPGRALRRLFLTHWHPDHCVGVERLKRETRCAVGASIYEKERVDPSLVDFFFRDGDRFRLEEWDLEVVHTPGHSSGHCCFFLPSRGVLFTGDHILGHGTSIIVPPDGDMALYLRSLERLLPLSLRVICPGHGPLVWEPREKIEEYIRHRLEREEKILGCVRGGVSSPHEMVRRVYTDVPEFLHGLAYYTALAHLEKLRRDGRVRKGPGEDRYEPV